MSIERIAGILALLVALVAAFVAIPYSGAIMAVLGLVVGYFIAAEDHVRVLVTAVVLATSAGALGAIPAIGDYLTAILTNLGSVVAAAAIAIILRNVINRVTG
jgi:hypothetical protein